MKLTIEIDMDNAAFDGLVRYAAIVDIMADVITALTRSSNILTCGGQRPLRDINGNTCGFLRVADNRGDD